MREQITTAPLLELRPLKPGNKCGPGSQQVCIQYSSQWAYPVGPGRDRMFDHRTPSEHRLGTAHYEVSCALSDISHKADEPT